MPASAERYDVALSFAGEDRSVADELASELRSHGTRVFYDRYEQASLWGKDLYQHLQSVYRDRARFCIVIVSDAYARKLWTKHELRQAQERAFNESREYILPVRLDDTQIPGLNATTAYIDLRSTTVAEIVRLTLEKLSLQAEDEPAPPTAHDQGLNAQLPAPRDRQVSTLRDRLLVDAPTGAVVGLAAGLTFYNASSLDLDSWETVNGMLPVILAFAFAGWLGQRQAMRIAILVVAAILGMVLAALLIKPSIDARTPLGLEGQALRLAMGAGFGIGPI